HVRERRRRGRVDPDAGAAAARARRHRRARPLRPLSGRRHRSGGPGRRLCPLDGRVSWPRDDAKLDRVRALMAEEELDALVVRAPDNVVYLSNFWGMKGYDAVVFPREGEPTLICLEASADAAASTAWTEDVRLFRGYDEAAPRPPQARALDAASEASRGYERVGVELSLGT